MPYFSLPFAEVSRNSVNFIHMFGQRAVYFPVNLETVPAILLIWYNDFTPGIEKYGTYKITYSGDFNGRRLYEKTAICRFVVREVR
jgi:hypothetical protein